jgi:Slx4 endonuclease
VKNITVVGKHVQAPLYESHYADSRSEHVQDLTCHEKSLLYRPIILNLTTWLNIEGLGMINEDREVDVVEVRIW